MALVKDTINAPPVPKPTTIQITSPAYKGVVADSREIPVSALLTHVEGSSWTCNYYSQILNDGSALAGQNVTVNPIYQQYRLIQRMELKVTGPLTSNQDTEGKTTTITGVATLYPFVIPNEGDMFLADIGDGREGIFRITNTERKSIYKQACYVVEYVMVDYATPERRADLNSKIVDRLCFSYDFLQHGQNPLIQEEVYEHMSFLAESYADMISYYFRNFTSDEFKTLILPGQSKPVYDPFLTKAVTSYFTTNDSYEVRKVRKLNCDGDDVLKTVQIWDILTLRDKTLMKHCLRRIGLVSAVSFEKNPMLEGIYHSGISYVVYPKDPELNVDYEINYKPKAFVDVALRSPPSKVRTLADLIVDNDYAGLTLPAVKLIHLVTVDDHYIFSSAFYNGPDEAQSLLELAVKDYINNKSVSIHALVALCRSHHSWGSLERFYFTPIIAMLIKSVVHGI